MAPALLDLRIEKLVHGGFGMARSGQGVVFVAGCAPGERVRARCIAHRAGTVFAEIVDIIEPSPSRRIPVCLYAGTCGGCDWQHLTYDAQVQAKAEITVESLTRTGRLRGIPQPEVFRSPQWAYRMRTQFKIDHTRQALGYFRRNSNTVVDIGACPLLCPELNALCVRRREILQSVRTDCRQIKAIAGEAAASEPVIEGITSGATTIRVGQRSFSVDGGGFFQANRFLLEALGTWASPFAKGALLWDIYGGAGFFSVMLGAGFGRGVLVESNRAQTAAARRAFASNGMAHLTAKEATAEAFLAAQSLGPDCCIVDPPRPGLTNAVRAALGRIKPQTLLYISCNPSTLARDAGFLVNRCGYRIARLAVFDLYPQTHHIEAAIALTRSAHNQCR